MLRYGGKQNPFLVYELCLMNKLFPGSRNNKKGTNEESKSDRLRCSFRLFDFENKYEGIQTNVEYFLVKTEKESKTKPSVSENAQTSPEANFGPNRS
jgi:hypothetical protein